MGNKNNKSERLRNYILDYTFDYADIKDLIRVIKISKKLFKLIKNKKDILDLQNKLILIPNESSIKVFNKSMILTKQLTGHDDYVQCLTQLSDNLIASGSRDNTVKIWNVKLGECIRTLEGHSSWVNTLAVLHNGFLVSGSYDFSIKIWNKEFTCIKTLEEHKKSVISLLTMHNGWLVSGSTDKLIKVWNSNEDFKCIYTLEGHYNCVWSIKQLDSKDLVSISSYDKGTIIIWSFNENFKNIKEWSLNGSSGYSLCVLPNNRIASGHREGIHSVIRIFEIPTMECISKIVHQGYCSMVSSLLLLSNGHLISAVQNRDVVNWKPYNKDTDLNKSNFIIRFFKSFKENNDSLFIVNNRIRNKSRFNSMIEI